MYCLSVHYENARLNGTGEYSIPEHPDGIQKWSVFPEGSSGTERLHLIAMPFGGTSILPKLPFSFAQHLKTHERPLHLECVMVEPDSDRLAGEPKGLWGAGIQVDCAGIFKSLRGAAFRWLPPGMQTRKAKTGIGDSSFFFLGYGLTLNAHDGTDQFDFCDPYFRLTRYHSLFCTGLPITDPVSFLQLLHYRAVRHRRLPPTHVMQGLAAFLPAYLEIDTSKWQEPKCDFRQEWSSLLPWQRLAVLPILDMVRHLLDAHPRETAPLNIATFVLFDRPDLHLPEHQLPKWLHLLDVLFPRAQFILTLGDRARSTFPPSLWTRSCQFTISSERPRRKPARLPKGAILLVDVDSTLPNLALMKLSRYFKDQGRPVTLLRRYSKVRNVDAVFASCVFSRKSSLDRIRRLRAAYGDALTAGGSGVDVQGRLPAAIERMPPDHSLYPELGDRGIGFLTRGCPFDCPFCIVPRKEGKPHLASTLDELLPDSGRKLILLDDNLLAHPKALELLEQMAVRDVAVNFTQTLDLRLVDEEKARRLRRIRCSNVRFTRRVYHFSLNDVNNMDLVRQKYALFGLMPKDNAEFICMFGFNTTLAEDVKRFRFLSSLPGAYVFVQRYQPVPGGPPAQLEGLFDEHADEHLNELIRIVFRQNMKSMECYYRWVSTQYAQTFGKLHKGLVDTMFKYNRRESKGLYMATLGGLRCLETV